MSPFRSLALAATVPLALGLIALACSGSGQPGDAGSDGAADARSGADVRDAGKDARDSGVKDSPTSKEAGPPSLVALTVSATSPSDSSPPVGLVPPFSPTTYDYYVRCGAGSNALTVSMTASVGAQSLLVQPIKTSPVPKQTQALVVMENQAIVAAAESEGVTTEYWVRCLPHDFPVLQMDPHPSVGVPTPGYYLVGNIFQLPAGESAYAMVLDGHGVPVWYYKPPFGRGVFNVDTIAPGTISFVSVLVTPQTYGVFQLAPLKTRYLIDSDEHELRLLPSGNYLLIGSPLVTGVDLTGVELPLADGGHEALGPNSAIRTCDLGEVDPAGNLVWVWKGLDHLDPAKDCVFPVTSGDTYDGGKVIDTFHCNSIDVDPHNGNLLVSARELDSVFYIERSSGKILWKMGGSAESKDTAAYVTVADPFHRQHDARLLPNWSPTCGTGQVTLFDDESSEPAVSRAVIYGIKVPPLAPVDGGAAADCGLAGDAGDAEASSATVVWQYRGTVNSFIMGSFRILPDGTRIIDWGARTKDKVTFTELDVHGNRVLDFTFDPDAGTASYRTVKVPTATFDLDVLRSTAGLVLTGVPDASPGGATGHGGDF